jgi:S1-C subfamily serine protease
VITRDDDLDLALLLLPNVQTWKPLEFVDRSASIPEDARLYSLGFPLASDLSSVEGLLSSHFGIGGKWQTTLPLNFGNSGGPVFDIGGRIVGVAAGGFDQAQNITYVIPADYLRALRSLLPTTCSQQASPTPPAASAASASAHQIRQSFQFSVTVDHQDQRDINDIHCLPEGFIVSNVTPSISSINGNGTRLISANPVPGRPNCVALQAFVRGSGVDRLGGIIVNHRGRGWLSGQLLVDGRRN